MRRRIDKGEWGGKPNREAAEIISHQHQLWSGAGWQAFSGNRESQEYERPRMLMTENSLPLRCDVCRSVAISAVAPTLTLSPDGLIVTHISCAGRRA